MVTTLHGCKKVWRLNNSSGRTGMLYWIAINTSQGFRSCLVKTGMETHGTQAQLSTFNVECTCFTAIAKMTLSSLLCLLHGGHQQIKMHILWNLGKIKMLVYVNTISLYKQYYLQLSQAGDVAQFTACSPGTHQALDSISSAPGNWSWWHMPETQQLGGRGRKISHSRLSSTLARRQ